MPKEKKPNGYWNYEHCKEEALKYSSRREFQKNCQFAYQISCKNKWIDDWLPSTTGKKWFEENCIEEAKKYHSRSEFQKKNPSAYSIARSHGWLDKCPWLQDQRFKTIIEKIDSVYAYEFEELNSVYVGRTLMRQQKTRHNQHITDDDDTVAKFLSRYHVSLPPMKILEENLTIEEGARKEGDYVKQYREDGWFIINIAKTGGIGNIGKSKWTKEKCFGEAQQYKTWTEFRMGSPRAYYVSLWNNWNQDYLWLEQTQRPKGYWDYDRCFQEAKKYCMLIDLIKDNETLYRIALNNDWLKDYSWLKRQQKPRGYWTKERCFMEAKRYKTKKELEKNNGSVYVISRRNGWLKDYVWMEKKSSGHLNGQLEIPFPE